MGTVERRKGMIAFMAFILVALAESRGQLFFKEVASQACKYLQPRSLMITSYSINHCHGFPPSERPL